jgi:hypothetical protein
MDDWQFLFLFQRSNRSSCFLLIWSKIKLS